MEYNDNEKSKKESKFDNNFYSSFWRFHLEAYRNEKGSGYIELTQQIYKVFGMSDADVASKSYINDTFGVDVVEIFNKKYCFVKYGMELYR